MVITKADNMQFEDEAGGRVQMLHKKRHLVELNKRFYIESQHLENKF